ncbi:HAMP domain-containing sensor histidine kinase [Clostridium sp. UBA1056]|uniref:sensor histidine kinase n=1 Tax=unclassified Clostridium TaxID=2614128 RepID=UPI003217A015
MTSNIKTLIKKWFNASNEKTTLIEILIFFIIGIIVLPKFFQILLVDYDNYTNRRSFYRTAIINEKTFKNQMLQNDTIKFREKLLSVTEGFSKILYCKTDEDAKVIQNYLEISLTDEIGVLLIDKSNNRWFSNRNWFSDYPFNELHPKEALMKLSKEDDVVVYSSNNLSHYSSPSGYYNGAYTSPNADLEEVYFIRGAKYGTMANIIRLRFYFSVPLLIIFIILVTKQLFSIKIFGIKAYINNFNNLLFIRGIKSINIFFVNTKDVFKNLFFDITLIGLLIFWIMYLPLSQIFNSNDYLFYSNDYLSYSNSYSNEIYTATFITFIIIVINICVRYLEGINNKKNLIKYLKKVEDGDMDVDINTKNFGTLSNLAMEINNLKVSYKKKVEEGIQNEKLKTELITNVSHDLKTPLTSIVNYVDILKDESLDKSEIRDYVTILDNKSTKLKKLVEDLFEMSKMSSGQIILSRNDVDIVELIHQNLGELSFLGEDKNLIFKVIGDKACHLSLDGAKISRVMDNLICNAIKYSLENSRIYLEIIENEAECEIIVKNISKYDLDFNENEILERFVRGDKSRNSSIEGSGLGLAISKTIVELHNGTLNVKCDGDLFKVIIKLPKS